MISCILGDKNIGRGGTTDQDITATTMLDLQLVSVVVVVCRTVKQFYRNGVMN